MKRFTLPQLKRHLSFEEKFGRRVSFFGSREKQKKPRVWPVVLAMCCMLGGSVLILSIMGAAGFWRIKDVTAPDGAVYTAAVLLEYADIRTGDGMLGFDTFAVAKDLKKDLPLLDKVKVRRHLNGTVSITVTELTNLYYTRHNQNYYIMNADTREVLGVFATPDEARRVGAVYLGIPEETRVRVGEKLSFINLPYEPDSTASEQYTYELVTDEPDKEFAYVFAFEKALMASPMADRVIGMELGDRFDLWFVLEGRIRVRVGTMEELDRKLALAQRSLEDRPPNEDLAEVYPKNLSIRSKK